MHESKLTLQQILKENNRRLDLLCKTKHTWLLKAAYNITKNADVSDDLVSELYLYIAERGNQNIWYGKDEFNMMYLHSYLRTRWINLIKKASKTERISDDWDTIDEDYDIDLDERIQSTYDEVVDEIKELQKTKMWGSARLAELYLFNDDMTLDKLSKEIGISKSTSFLNVRKIKQHIRNTKANPFR